MEGLQISDLQRLCCQLLGSQGGVSLAQSLLRPPQVPPPVPDSSEMDWCVCGKCKRMPTNKENECCKLLPCASTSEDFQIICLHYSVLTLAIHNCEDVYADGVPYSQARYRKAAYRQYVLNKYGHLGSGNRRIIPSCIVWCIRNKYPDEHGHYSGFKEH